MEVNPIPLLYWLRSECPRSALTLGNACRRRGAGTGEEDVQFLWRSNFLQAVNEALQGGGVHKP